MARVYCTKVSDERKVMPRPRNNSALLVSSRDADRNVVGIISLSDLAMLPSSSAA